MPTTETFNFTGSVETFTVPANVYYVDLDLTGAQGGDNSKSGDSGGLGGRVTGRLPVSPGDTLNIRVGGQGTPANSDGVGGWPNGGDGGTSDGGDGEGAGGGGSSGVRRNGDTVSDIAALAGGGGGCGDSTRDDTTSVQSSGADGGGEGQDAVGFEDGGDYYADPAEGGASGGWQGGDGQAEEHDDGSSGGGGGGGGLNGGEGGHVGYGGGWQAATGGGGGDGYVGSMSNTSMVVGDNAGDGQVTLTYSVAPTLDTIDTSTDRELSIGWTNEDTYDDVRVLRATSSGSTAGDYTTVATVAGSQTSYTDSGLLDGERYYYRVEGVVNGDSTGVSNELDALTNFPAPSDITTELFDDE